jgi:hypothetical protein
MMVAIDVTGQTLLDYVEERSSAAKSLYLGSVMIGFLAVVLGNLGSNTPGTGLSILYRSMIEPVAFCARLLID